MKRAVDIMAALVGLIILVSLFTIVRFLRVAAFVIYFH